MTSTSDKLKALAAKYPRMTVLPPAKPGTAVIIPLGSAKAAEHFRKLVKRED
jgi:hypothetical protein